MTNNYKACKYEKKKALSILLKARRYILLMHVASVHIKPQMFANFPSSKIWEWLRTWKLVGPLSKDAVLCSYVQSRNENNFIKAGKSSCLKVLWLCHKSPYYFIFPIQAKNGISLTLRNFKRTMYILAYLVSFILKAISLDVNAPYLDLYNFGQECDS